MVRKIQPSNASALHCCPCPQRREREQLRNTAQAGPSAVARDSSINTSFWAGVGKRLIPLLDRILVERFVPEAKTKGGIMIPEKAQAKVHSATVVAVGPGGRSEFEGKHSQSGQTIPMAVKEGDKVLLPEYGGTKVEIDNKEFYIFRDSDVLGKWAN
ncbi:hypothetical protein V5799_027066 [Amblyomma americanum]|uniref:10 kDa heat shock protein, mitochondrial n=1 Tax=Amblyomma americanum TaxID=6943 RepID=A0AAQ4DGS9_AMBAM